MYQKTLFLQYKSELNIVIYINVTEMCYYLAFRSKEVYLGVVLQRANKMRHLIINFDVSINFSSYCFIIQHQTVIQFWSSTDSINSKLQQTTNPKTSCSKNSKLLQVKLVSMVCLAVVCQRADLRGGSRISRKGVRMYKGMGSLC